MIKSLQPIEFCQKWVPKTKGKRPGEYGYRKACCELLSELTGSEPTTTNNWLAPGYRTPLLLGRYLQVVDSLWNIQKTARQTYEDE